MGSQPVTESRTHGPTHELLTGAGQNVSTDVNGNITVIPAALRPNASSLTSTWDFDNRMVSTDVGSNGSVEVSHQYDALGRRVARTAAGSTTVFVQAGQQTVADYVSGTAPASSTYRYIYASYIDEPVMRWQTSNSTALYYHRNQQYSVYAVSNSSGAVQERYAYTAYGVPTIANASGTVLTASAISNRYLYTGRERDNDIQQYHYRARMYDASLGRFCSRDPVGYADGWSLYSSYLGLIALDPNRTFCIGSATSPIIDPQADPRFPNKIVGYIGAWIGFNSCTDTIGDYRIHIGIDSFGETVRTVGVDPDGNVILGLVAGCNSITADRLARVGANPGLLPIQGVDSSCQIRVDFQPSGSGRGGCPWLGITIDCPIKCESDGCVRKCKPPTSGSLSLPYGPESFAPGQIILFGWSLQFESTNCKFDDCSTSIYVSQNFLEAV
jgi:RHS repeat-associated protein